MRQVEHLPALRVKRGVEIPAAEDRLPVSQPRPLLRQRAQRLGQHPKRARKPRHDNIPVVMVAPRTVDENHGCAVVTTRLGIEVASIDYIERHSRIITRLLRQRQMIDDARDALGFARQRDRPIMFGRRTDRSAERHG